jgi:hypothetical protein
MQGILYRAVAYVHGRPSPEVHVFFEAPPLTNPGEELLQLLNCMWRTGSETVEIYNIVDEYKLISLWAVGDAFTGDARLLELGLGAAGRVAYCLPSRTLLLVSPPVLLRLVKAQDAAQSLAKAGYTVQRAQVAA